ncbi:MAG: conjugative transposon protein TraM [Tenuifilaceae bacterium]
MNENKFLYIFIVVLLFMVLGVGFYLYSTFTAGHEPGRSEIDVKKSKMQTRDSVNINEDRVKSYAKDDTLNQSKKLNIEWSRMSFKKKKTEDNREAKNDEQQTTTRQVSRSYTTGKKQQTVIHDTVRIETKTTTEILPKYDPGGFGIVESKKSTNTRSNTNQGRSAGFFSAMLEEDTQVKQGSSVVFFLLEDCTFNSIQFKKNSILYGKATVDGKTFDIHIFQIMSTDNTVYSMTGLVVYDEKYSRGLTGEGTLNEAVRESANQTTDETTTTLTNTGNVAANGVGIAAKALNNTIKAITRKKEPTINLFKGYKVFIKQE